LRSGLEVSNALSPASPSGPRPRQSIESGLSRVSPDLGVAKPVEGEVRLEDFGAAASRDVDVRRPSGPQIRGIEISVGGEHFREAHLDPGARFGLDPESGEPHEVLAEVEDVNPGDGSVRPLADLSMRSTREVLSHQLRLRRRRTETRKKPGARAS
jgi:hypothetical protein